jgi:hypothetical protein
MNISYSTKVWKSTEVFNFRPVNCRDPARQMQTGTRASTACSPGDAITERRLVQALLGEARRFLHAMK